MLLTEFDANRQAIINPEALHEPLEGFPKIAVSCFSRLTFQRMLEMFPHELIYEISMANVAIPIYKLVIDDNELALFNAPVGASACVGILEDIFALGELINLYFLVLVGCLMKILKRLLLLFLVMPLEMKGRVFTMWKPAMRLR